MNAKLRFQLGEVVTTPGALEALTAEEIETALRRHQTGDWGAVSPADAERNEQALRDGDRLFSSYRSADKTRFLVITEADRSSTTVLLPDEY
jgi:hypothetical protein